MTDAYVEFLTENSQRKYPIREDAIPKSGGFELPDGIILDIQGFSKALPTGGCKIYGYSGATSSGPAPTNPGALSSSLFVSVGRLLIRLDVPEATVTFPVTVSATSLDASTGKVLSNITATIGEEWVNLDKNARYLFLETAPLEEMVIVNLYKQQVDYIGITDPDSGFVTFVMGDVVMVGGYNTQITQKDNELIINCTPGYGSLGRHEDDDQGDGCKDWVYTISGVSSDSAGRIKFIGGKGISVTGIPNGVKISLSTDGVSPVGGCQ